LKKGQTYLAP